MATVYYMGKHTLNLNDYQYQKLKEKLRKKFWWRFTGVDLLHQNAIQSFQPCTMNMIDLIQECDVKFIAVDGFDIPDEWKKACKPLKISFFKWNGNDWENVA